MNHEYLVGADPEVFLKNPNNGSFFSAAGLLPGTKREPHVVPSGAVQVDGMAAEFNIQPAHNADEFVGNVDTVYKFLQGMISGSGYVTCAEPVAIFDKGYFDDQDIEAKLLGCDPDFDAWTGLKNEVTFDIDTPMRTAAGHIHVGWLTDVDPTNPSHFNECCARVKQLDYYVGVYSLLWDRDARRRTLYGKAGAFRPKPYGLEYRVPSNAWLNSSTLQRWLYHACIKAMTDFDKGIFKFDEYGDQAQDIINHNRVNWVTMMDFETGLTMPPKIRLAA